jgi:hypothetical protein
MHIHRLFYHIVHQKHHTPCPFNSLMSYRNSFEMHG